MMYQMIGSNIPREKDDNLRQEKELVLPSLTHLF